jgi:hypothetical protein
MSPKTARLLVLALLTVGTGVAGVGLLRSASVPAAGATSVSQKVEVADAILTPDQVSMFDQFALYSGGASTDGYSLTNVDQIELPPTAALQQAGITNWNNSVTFEYGTCTPAGTGNEWGCPDPVQIQIWPACDRTLADYPKSGTYGQSYSESQTLGVPSAVFDEGDGSRLELYTGDVTIVIWAPSLAEEQKVAANLSPANKLAVDAGGTVGPDGSYLALPAPVDGALTGQLACSHT